MSPIDAECQCGVCSRCRERIGLAKSAALRERAQRVASEWSSALDHETAIEAANTTVAIAGFDLGAIERAARAALHHLRRRFGLSISTREVAQLALRARMALERAAS